MLFNGQRTNIYIKAHGKRRSELWCQEREIDPSTQREAVYEAKTQANQRIGVSAAARGFIAAVAALSSSIKVILTVGTVHDVSVAEKPLSGDPLKGTTILTDKAYGK